MKTKLQFLGLTACAVILGFQTGFAQTGGAFNGPHNAGTAANTGGDAIFFRDFDLGDNENASPTVATPTAGTDPDLTPNTSPYGYFDATIGNSAGNGTTFIKSTYRSGTDVDVPAPSGGLSQDVIALNVNGGNEYLYYTVVFAEDGNYHIDVNYGHSNGTPRGIKFELLDVAFANEPVLLANGSLVKTNAPVDSGPGTTSGGSSTQYSNASGEIINPVTDRPTNAASIVNGTTIQFDVAAGTHVIKMTTPHSGPNFVWFKFVRDGNAITLNTNKITEEANSLTVYPNPATDGKFQLSVESKWDVYSVVGVKVLKGEGKNVDLSSLPKGVYVLKTPTASKMLVSK